MAKKRRKNNGSQNYKIGLSDGTKRGLWVLILIASVILLVFSFFGYAGMVGDTLDQLLALVFGWIRIIVPITLLVILYYLIKSEIFDIPITKYIGLAMLLFGFGAVFHIFIPPDQMLSAASQGKGGGYLGYVLAFYSQQYVGIWVSRFFVFALILAGFLIFFDLPLSAIFIGSEEKPSWLTRLWMRWQEEKQAVLEEADEDEEEDSEEEDYEEDESSEKSDMTDEKNLVQEQNEVDDEDVEVEEIHKSKPKKHRRIKVPLELLDTRESEPNSGDIQANMEIIRRTLENFNIPVEMGEVNVGPTVTQYTLKPAEGIKLTRIMALNNDLALALAAHPIRIEAPIPGKSAIGIEVPNKSGALVGLKGLLDSIPYRKARKKNKLVIPLGEDVAGNPFISALEKLPHLLVAGATGSGKSVCVNSLIVSLLYQHGPDDLKFIMVDPKRVELPVYNRIPHLLTPVITDVKKTINALKWLIVEMDRRYDTLAAVGKRNIAAYNEVADDNMPYIILIIDELADLMIAAANDVESHIIRLAQMARAVGIHLVLATQRPSVDVITGLLKANIPGRIAFSVASAVDSRTILDIYGAEKLVGRGDMLFTSAEISKPKRIQGPFVSEYEVKRVVSYLAEEIGEPEFDEEIVEKQKTPTAFAANDEDGDDLFDEAKELVLQAQKASTSYLQRKLRVGYARAARLMDLLEDAGVVGSQDGSRAREVLIATDEDDIIEEESDINPDFVGDGYGEVNNEKESDDQIENTDQNQEDYDEEDDQF